MFKRILKDPVLHFLVVGTLLYVVAMALRGPELEADNTRLIRVDREALLEFMQFRSNLFDAEVFDAALVNMSDEELQFMIDEYITEEVLYREAQALGLDASDYIIRQRMVEKMSFLLGDLAGAEIRPTDDELQAYLDESREAFVVKPSATFTHVFFDASVRGEAEARAAAEAAMAEMNAEGVGFNGVSARGDRFPFLRNYVERTLEFMQGHFGPLFVQQLQELEPAEALWQGPLQSAYGYHVVMLTELRAARYPRLDEIRSEVELEYIGEQSREALAEMIGTVREQYDVEVEALRDAP